MLLPMLFTCAEPQLSLSQAEVASTPIGSQHRMPSSIHSCRMPADSESQ